MYSIGTSEIIAVLPAATIEILFMVVQDKDMPIGLDVVIGWDAIRCSRL